MPKDKEQENSSGATEQDLQTYFPRSLTNRTLMYTFFMPDGILISKF